MVTELQTVSISVSNSPTVIDEARISAIKDKLATIHGGFCGLTIQTQPKTRKGAPTITKRTRLVVQLCGYESAVNRRAAQEGLPCKFRAEALWNGKGRHLNKYIVEHTGTGKLYLAYTPVNILEESYFVGGIEVSKESIEEYLIGSSPSNRQPQEKVVHWRVVAIENILDVRQG